MHFLPDTYCYAPPSHAEITIDRVPQNRRWIQARWRKVRCALAIVTYLASSQLPVRADPAVPRPCVGYNIETQQWGAQRPSAANLEVLCPPGEAFAGVSPATKLLTDRGTAGYCCPLPTDALLSGSVWVDRTCPDGSVITGSRFVQPGGAAFRCSKIDATKYRMAPSQPGQRVELAEDFPLGVRESLLDEDSVRLPRGALPPILRYGLGRTSWNTWESSICVGNPPGAFLTAVESHKCRLTSFRSLQSITREAPPPSCDAIDNPFSTHAQCLSRSKGGVR